MRLIYTVFEMISSLIFLSFGWYVFHSGFAASTGASMYKLSFGAAIIFGGGFAIYSSSLSCLRHRRRERGISMQVPGKAD
jgi:hypothetical protein